MGVVASLCCPKAFDERQREIESMQEGDPKEGKLPAADVQIKQAKEEEYKEWQRQQHELTAASDPRSANSDPLAPEPTTSLEGRPRREPESPFEKAVLPPCLEYALREQYADLASSSTAHGFGVTEA